MLGPLYSPALWIIRRLVIDQAAALRLPAIYEWPETAEQGGFAAYGSRIAGEVTEKVARLIVKLFRGTKVADIPVEQPTKFELVINLKTAKAMGVVTAVPAAADFNGVENGRVTRSH
jgi:putative ABC transport system substrate-binding protein